MFTSLSRLVVIAVVVSCSLTQSNAADVAPHPRSVPFTVFPELKPPSIDSNSVVAVPDLPADTFPLRKVRRAQAIAGFRYLIQMRGTIHDGWWSDSYLPDLVMMTNETYRAAAEAEDALANRVPWYENRVRAMKSIEQFIEERVRLKKTSILHLHLTRFIRYGCEADLLRLIDEVAKTSNAKGRPLVTQSVDIFLRDTKSLASTALPELKASLRAEPPPTRKDDPWASVLELEANASPLRKLQFARGVSGVMYRFGMCEVIRIGSSSWWNTYTNAYIKMFEPALATVDLDEPANRVVGYERAVTMMKTYERRTQIRIDNGTAPPLALDLVSFRRLEAEARLLQLKDQIAKSGAKPTQPGKRILIDMDPYLSDRMLPDTAFPELKSPAFESREMKDSDGSTLFIGVEKDAIPLPALPDLPTSASPIRKVRLAQIREGLAYIDATKHYISTGSWNQLYFAEYLQIASDVFRVAAELEDIPAKRLAWYEARVRRLKGIEHFIERRVKLGTAPPQDLDMASFVRLQGEIDLLKLKAEVEPVRHPLVAPICQPIYCPPACVCPRPRILPRLFRR